MNEQNNHKKKKRHNKRYNLTYLDQQNNKVNSYFNQNEDNTNEINQEGIFFNDQINNQYIDQDDVNVYSQNNVQFNNNSLFQKNKSKKSKYNNTLDLNEINPNIHNPFNQTEEYLLNNEQLAISQVNTSDNKINSSNKNKINKSITLAELTELNKEKMEYNNFSINLETEENNNLKIIWDIDYKYITTNSDNIKLFISGYDNKYDSSLLVYNLTPALSPIINYINLINNNKGEITLTNLTKGFYTLKYTEKYAYEYCIGKQVNININEDYNEIKLLKVSIECNNEDCILALFKREELTNDLSKSILYLKNSDGTYKDKFLYFNIPLKYLSGNFVLKYFYITSLTPFFNSYSGYKEIFIENKDDINISYDKTCKMFKINWKYNSSELTKPNSITNGAYLEITVNNKIIYEYIFNYQYNNSLIQEGYILTNIFDIIIDNEPILIKLMNVNKFGLFPSCVLIREFKPDYFNELKKE